MDNATRRQLLMRHRQSGYPGSILDVFKAYDMGIDLLGQFEQQNNIQVAQTPQQQQQGLRPAHQAGNISQSMIFPNVPPNTPFNTVGMKAPINIEKYDEQGHLVKSYENVPPGVQNLPTGPQRGTVIETPANMQSGGGLLSTPGLSGPMMARGLVAEGKRRIANNLFPSGYTSESENMRPEERLYSAIVLNRPERGSKADTSPMPEAPNEQSLKEREDLLGYAMGQHDNLPAADYRPTDAQDTDAVYFKSPSTEQNLIETLESEEDALKWINRHTANGDGGVAYHTGVHFNVLGNYTLDKGKDDKGHYISYYDIWDLDPFRGRAGKAVNIAKGLMGVRAPEVYGRIYYDPKTGKPITEKKQAGGPKEDYNMARAKELGYKPDATGHYPSVDHETGMLLKSKEHPTVKLEFMSQMLSPERKMIANPTGYFGENQLQYVPRKMQSGGIKFQDTMDFIDREYGPDQFGDTLTLNAMDLISEHRQGITNPWAVRDTIAYHETGSHQRMQPNAVQIVKDKDSTSTTFGQLVPGVGRGKYMYDKPSTLTAANRVDSLSSYMGLETPGFIRDLQRSEGTSRADTLTGTQQDMLYMGDLIEGPAPGKAYGAGEATLEDVWYKGHNRREDEKGARLEFRESMRGIAQDNLRDYYFAPPKPNFFERQKQRHGGPMRKYFRLRK